MKSHSIDVRPNDSRCRYWAKIVRAGQALPTPDRVHGANDLPGQYHRRGDDELLPGDCLFEGESNHHRRRDRGFWYCLTYVTLQGEVLVFVSGFGAQKKQMKAQGLPRELLTGSGDIAAMVRIVHGLRAGLTVTPD